MALAKHVPNAYEIYQAERSPENLSKVVDSLGPTIKYSLAQYNSMDDPLVHGHARLFAAHAVEQFDPTHEGAASLPTFVSSHLRQLNRTVRQSRSPVNMPERMQLDAYKMSQAVKSFQDEHGREPDSLELADATGMPIKRIAKVRRSQVAVPSEVNGGDLPGNDEPDHDAEALDYVYHDADHTDRRILEMKTGYAGHPVMPPQMIALHLKLTPTQLSRRSMRLTAKINALREGIAKIS